VHITGDEDVETYSRMMSQVEACGEGIDMLPDDRTVQTHTVHTKHGGEHACHPCAWPTHNGSSHSMHTHLYTYIYISIYTYVIVMLPFTLLCACYPFFHITEYGVYTYVSHIPPPPPHPFIPHGRWTLMDIHQSVH